MKGTTPNRAGRRPFQLACALAGLAGLAPAQDEPAGDAHAGKTVADRQAGMNLIQERGKNAPKAGEEAPDFTLATPDGKRSVTLSSFKHKKPVVLIFGSYT